MIPQTAAICKPFLGKNKTRRRKSTVAPCSRPGVWETPGHANALREFLAGSMARRGGFYAAGRMGPAGRRRRRRRPGGARPGPPGGRAEPGQARPEGGSRRGRSRRLHKTGVGAAAGASPLPAGIQKIKAGAVPLLPGPAQCRRWPADFWCAGGDHWAPCRAGRTRPPPRGPPSWKGS